MPYAYSGHIGNGIPGSWLIKTNSNSKVSRALSLILALFSLHGFKRYLICREIRNFKIVSSDTLRFIAFSTDNYLRRSSSCA
jgi:hypothetical protein